MDDKLEHPFKYTCSGWQQGYDVGKATTERKLALADAVIKESRGCLSNGEYHGEDCPGEDNPNIVDEPGKPEDCECGIVAWRGTIKAYEAANES